MSEGETTKRGTQRGYRQKENVSLVEAKSVDSPLESLDGDYLVVIADKSPKQGESILLKRGEKMELRRAWDLEDLREENGFKGVVAATIKLDP